MGIGELLTPSTVLPRLKASCKKQVLEQLSGFAAERLEKPAESILECLLERERLGSTGVGSGVAIPHGKIEGVDRIFGVLARLDAPIEFEAVDDGAVDLVFMLLAPPDAGANHLKALAKVSRMFRDKSVCESLRAANSAEAIYSIATEMQSTHAA